MADDANHTGECHAGKFEYPWRHAGVETCDGEVVRRSGYGQWRCDRKAAYRYHGHDYCRECFWKLYVPDCTDAMPGIAARDVRIGMVVMLNGRPCRVVAREVV